MAFSTRSWVLVVVGCAVALAGEPSLVPESGVLALRNGRLLEGRITKAGDTYVVSFAAENDVRVPVAEVEYVAPTRDALYRLRRDALSRRDVESHLQLADWSLRHGLLHRAADQFLAAAALDPADARLRPFERRLLAANKMAQPRPAEAPPAAEMSEAADKVNGNLPAKAIESFTSIVQPVLLNRCAMAGCHGAGAKSGYRLARPVWGHALTRRFTQQNLQATLEMIDWKAPEASPLLRYARSPHGGSARAWLDDATRYEQLAAWVREVTDVPETAAAAVVGATAPVVTRSTEAPSSPETSPAKDLVIRPRGSTARMSAAIGPPGDAQPGVTPPGTTPRGTTPRGTTVKPDEKSGAAPASAYVPRDPFDPEVFNRRFLESAERR